MIGDWGAGATPSRSHPEYYQGDIPWLKTGDLTDGYITSIPESISALALEKTSVKLNPAGSILMAMYGATIGKLGILTYPATTNQACCACLPYNGISNLFLFYYLMGQRESFIKKGEGGAQPNISKEKIVASFIAIPPAQEQLRIVASIASLLPLVDNYKKTEQELASLNKKLPEFLKKSILQHAIQGKLVPQDPNDEPASVLLERIAEERTKLGKKAAKSMSRIERRDRGTFQIYPDGKEIDITKEIPFDIPDSWEWCRLGSIVDVKGGKRVPVGMSTTTEKTEHIYIRVSDMTNQTISEKNLVYVSEEVYSKISAYTISKDDLYLTIAGTIGKVGMVPEKFDGMNLTENAVKITSIPIEKRFLLNLLMSDLCVSQFAEKTNQVAQPKLAIQRILSVLIPIPPKDEQIRISDALENALGKIVKIGYCGQGNL